MDMGGHNRGGASKMFLVETKSGHSITNYLGRGHKDKTRGAGDYSLAREKFISQSHKSRHNVPISDHSRKLSACTSCEGCKKIKCTETAKCYWDDDDKKCFPQDCVEDADCIGQKYRDDVTEEGDLYCDMDDYVYGNQCRPADCEVCEGCKDFRCGNTWGCAVIKKSGGNTTTCVSNSCKTNEDCKKFIGNIVEDISEDSEIEDGDLICDKEDKHCIEAPCKSCEGCKKHRCWETDKCYWHDDEEKCFSHECVEDADCIGQKFDNGEISEDGDMFCLDYDDKVNRCFPKNCDGCDGCKEFRCSETSGCAAITKSGENSTTCISRSCKTNEDCKKFVNKIVLVEDYGVKQSKKEDYWACKKFEAGRLGTVWGWCYASNMTRIRSLASLSSRGS